MESQSPELLPGALDLLILRVQYLIRNGLQPLGDTVAVHGLASQGASENNRRARFYTITAAGRWQFNAEREEFHRVIAAIQNVLETA